jgi:aquaporin-3
LVGLTIAVIDPNNAKAHTGVQPIPLAFIVYGIVMAFGHNTGAPINPAMDLGARLFTAAAGWGSDVFV